MGLIDPTSRSDRLAAVIRIQLLTSPDCAHCETVRALLIRVQTDRQDVAVEEIDATSPLGLRLSIEHGVLVMPGVIVNGRFLAMGAVTEAALRQELARGLELACIRRIGAGRVPGRRPSAPGVLLHHVPAPRVFCLRLPAPPGPAQDDLRLRVGHRAGPGPDRTGPGRPLPALLPLSPRDRHPRGSFPRRSGRPGPGRQRHDPRHPEDP